MLNANSCKGNYIFAFIPSRCSGIFAALVNDDCRISVSPFSDGCRNSATPVTDIAFEFMLLLLIGTAEFLRRHKSMHDDCRIFAEPVSSCLSG